MSIVTTRFQPASLLHNVLQAADASNANAPQHAPGVGNFKPAQTSRLVAANLERAGRIETVRTAHELQKLCTHLRISLLDRPWDSRGCRTAELMRFLDEKESFEPANADDAPAPDIAAIRPRFGRQSKAADSDGFRQAKAAIEQNPALFSKENALELLLQLSDVAGFENCETTREQLSLLLQMIIERDDALANPYQPGLFAAVPVAELPVAGDPSAIVPVAGEPMDTALPADADADEEITTQQPVNWAAFADDFFRKQKVEFITSRVESALQRGQSTRVPNPPGGEHGDDPLVCYLFANARGFVVQPLSMVDHLDPAVRANSGLKVVFPPEGPASIQFNGVDLGTDAQPAALIELEMLLGLITPEDHLAHLMGALDALPADAGEAKVVLAQIQKQLARELNLSLHDCPYSPDDTVAALRSSLPCGVGDCRGHIGTEALVNALPTIGGELAGQVNANWQKYHEKDYPGDLARWKELFNHALHWTHPALSNPIEEPLRFDHEATDVKVIRNHTEAERNSAISRLDGLIDGDYSSLKTLIGRTSETAEFKDPNTKDRLQDMLCELCTLIENDDTGELRSLLNDQARPALAACGERVMWGLQSVRAIVQLLLESDEKKRSFIFSQYMRGFFIEDAAEVMASMCDKAGEALETAVRAQTLLRTLGYLTDDGSQVMLYDHATAAEIVTPETLQDIMQTVLEKETETPVSDQLKLVSKLPVFELFAQLQDPERAREHKENYRRTLDLARTGNDQAAENFKQARARREECNVEIATTALEAAREVPRLSFLPSAQSLPLEKLKDLLGELWRVDGPSDPAFKECIDGHVQKTCGDSSGMKEQLINQFRQELLSAIAQQDPQFVLRYWQTSSQAPGESERATAMNDFMQHELAAQV